MPWFSLGTEEDESISNPGFFYCNYKGYTFSRVSTIFWLNNQSQFRRTVV
jgi:hypothetical protein